MIRSDFIAWVALMLIAAAIGSVLWIFCMLKWASWIDPKRIENKAARQKLDETISRSEIDRFKKQLFALEKTVKKQKVQIASYFNGYIIEHTEIIKRILELEKKGKQRLFAPLGNFLVPKTGDLKTGNYEKVRWFKKKEIKEALESEKNKRRKSET